MEGELGCKADSLFSAFSPAEGVTYWIMGTAVSALSSLMWLLYSCQCFFPLFVYREAHRHILTVNFFIASHSAPFVASLIHRLESHLSVKKKQKKQQKPKILIKRERKNYE